MSTEGPTHATAHLMPRDIVDLATSRGLASFTSVYGDTLLLLVRLPDGDVDVSSGLGSTAVRGVDGTRVRPTIGSMEFHTLHQPVGAEARLDRGRPPQDLGGRLDEGAHFVVPLRKRADVDAAFMERISIGRAINKDIVLRHQSVSKFHAWFEVDEAGTFQLVDAGSKNSTWVNGKAILPRERTPVEPGDLLRFGSIDATLCTARELWTTLNRGRARAEGSGG